VRAVTQQRPHDVHLRVAGAGVRAGSVDLLEDDRRLGDVEAAAAVLFRNQCRKPACLGQRFDERIRITVALFDVLPVLAVELRTEFPDSPSIFVMFVSLRIDISHQETRTGAKSSDMSWQRSTECSAPSIASAVCGPKRDAMSAEHFRSSSSVDTGFSGLPLGCSLAARSVAPSFREIVRRTGHADGYLAVRSSATITFTRRSRSAVARSRTPSGPNRSSANCSRPSVPSSNAAATQYARLNFA